MGAAGSELGFGGKLKARQKDSRAVSQGSEVKADFGCVIPQELHVRL